MYKTGDIDTGVLFPELILFAQLMCIQRHRLREQRPFLSISPHNSIPYFLVLPAKPGRENWISITIGIARHNLVFFICFVLFILKCLVHNAAH